MTDEKPDDDFAIPPGTPAAGEEYEIARARELRALADGLRRRHKVLESNPFTLPHTVFSPNSFLGDDTYSQPVPQPAVPRPLPDYEPLEPMRAEGPKYERWREWYFANLARNLKDDK